MTWLIVVQTPGLDVVLRELGVSQQLHRVGEQLYIALGEGGLNFYINTSLNIQRKNTRL